MNAPPLLGIDGGASGVRVHAIEELATGRLRPSGRSVEQSWEGWPGFRPVPLARQLAEREAGRLELDEAERRAGQARVHTLANAVAQLTFGLELRAGLRLGVCLPGLKSADGRGVEVARNGPRIPEFTDELVRQLRGRNLTLAAPPGRLVSDGEACGWGEEHAPSGAFGGVPSAYYVACGTGVAEALKVGGRHVDLTRYRDRLPPAWSLAGPRGTLEDELSLGTLARDLAEAAGGRLDGSLEDEARRAAADGREVLARWARALGAFLARRLGEIAARDGRIVDRIVVGQRSGRLLADPALESCVRAPLEAALEEALAEAQDVRMRAAYVERDASAPGLVVASTLRAAPAIGAAAAALGRAALEPA